MSQEAPNETFKVGIDIGGTFTDCVVASSDGSIVLGKALSTPPNFTDGIVDALTDAADQMEMTDTELLTRTVLFLHSTTVAENAIVDGALAPVGLLTTKGFRYTLWAMRGGYGRWFGLSDDEKRNPVFTDKPSPIVPLSMTREVGERVAADGTVIQALDVSELREAVSELIAAGAKAFAVCFLWSFAHSQNERMAREVIKELSPDAFVSLSSEVAPTIGEYERTSTTAINAGLGPVVDEYLSRLTTGLAERGLRGPMFVMQGYGGLADVAEARRRAAGLIESGPVSGLIGSARLGSALGRKNVISADMGGTTFKVGTVRDGLIEYQRESAVVRYHLAIPKMDVVSLGVAGGSIISIDPEGGVPRIGPESAGSVPGPVCYGAGGEEPTITDVDAILGYLNGDFFLGGRKPLLVEKAREVFDHKVASKLLVDVERSAASIYRLVGSLIFDFLHKTTVQRGLDPRSFSLVSTGGTAGMHLPGVGRALGVSETIVPYAASVYGAFGLVTSDIAFERMVTRPIAFLDDNGDVAQEVDEIFGELTAEVAEQLTEMEQQYTTWIELMIDMRFRRQVHVVTVPLQRFELAHPQSLGIAQLRDAVDRFERMYLERYGPGSAYREAGVELVSFRVRGSLATGSDPSSTAEHGNGRGRELTSVGVRRVYVADLDEFREVDCYDFRDLGPGDRIVGPAVIWTPITTVVIDSCQQLTMDEMRNLVIRDLDN